MGLSPDRHIHGKQPSARLSNRFLCASEKISISANGNFHTKSHEAHCSRPAVPNPFRFQVFQFLTETVPARYTHEVSKTKTPLYPVYTSPQAPGTGVRTPKGTRVDSGRPVWTSGWKNSRPLARKGSRVLPAVPVDSFI